MLTRFSQCTHYIQYICTYDDTSIVKLMPVTRCNHSTPWSTLCVCVCACVRVQDEVDLKHHKAVEQCSNQEQEIRAKYSNKLKQIEEEKVEEPFTCCSAYL